MKIVVSEPSDGDLGPFLDLTASHRDVAEVSVARTGRETAEAVRSSEFDVLVFPDEWAEMCRAIRVSLGLTAANGPSFVVATDKVTPSLIVKSALYGFEGAVPARVEPAEALSRVIDIARGVNRLDDEPLLGNLGLRPGTLARKISAGDGVDREISDLVAAGLTDADIARVTGLSLQVVRNRVEGLLHANGLTHRTQLAVLRASLWEVPDFL